MIDKGALVKVPLCSLLPAPGTPSFLVFSEVTSTTLNVSWGEPAAANGILQGYRVVYEPLAPVQGKGGMGQLASQMHSASQPVEQARGLLSGREQAELGLAPRWGVPALQGPALGALVLTPYISIFSAPQPKCSL